MVVHNMVLGILITFSAKIMHCLKCYQGTFCLNVHPEIVVKFVDANICTMLPHCIQLESLFHKNYVSVEILSRGIFVTVYIKKLHGGICRCRYPYHVATSHSTLIVLSMNIIYWSKFYHGAFSFQCSSRNCDRAVSATIHSVYPHHIQL
jgi:hypothetical protein